MAVNLQEGFLYLLALIHKLSAWLSKQSALCIDNGWHGFVCQIGVGTNEEMCIREERAREVVDLAIPKAV